MVFAFELFTADNLSLCVFLLILMACGVFSVGKVGGLKWLK